MKFRNLSKHGRRNFTACLFLFLGFAGSVASARGADADLAQQALNPVAALISLPMKLDWDTGIGPADADRSVWVVQPVIPIELNDKWNVISRTVTPVWIDLDATFQGGKSTSGMGDILQSFFFSPKDATASGWIWGVGPAINVPTSSEPGLGTDTWGLGPTFVALKQSNGWTYGMLANQLWGLSDMDNGDKSSAMLLQPFLSFTTSKFTTFGINTESTYDWNSNEWTIPLNLSVTQMLKLGEQPLTIQLGYRHYLDAPSGGPDWGVRFQLTLLFPK